ncbi:hypothetical protein [Pelagibaculum spongiae]|uniref:hypothetical protein n=1 Tax=Pelagibaculum spongiae TaxID=2080658 RepID=UPI000E31897E|nr:hypothetical protein [Pelagibaculum spongiae]
MDKRWGISIDIEGFSNLYEYNDATQTKAIRGLHQLMDAVIKIGQKVYPGDPNKNYWDRIFAHQFGDGFILVSNFKEPDPSRCIAIATSLSRYMLLQGYATKAAISTGDMNDISGCYPDAMKSAKNNTLGLGMGLITSIPVMGTALTKAHNLAGRVSGNVVVIDVTQFSCVPEYLIKDHEGNIGYINWMSDENSLAQEISEKAGLQYGNENQLSSLFSAYIVVEPCPPQKWIEGSQKCQNT